VAAVAEAVTHPELVPVDIEHRPVRQAAIHRLKAHCHCHRQQIIR
jgi:hypothetical protein